MMYESIGDAVRVTYEHDGEEYFFDGYVVANDLHKEVRGHPGKILVGKVRDLNTDQITNVYNGDKIEFLVSLHTHPDA